MLFSRSLDHINARVNDMPTVRSATGFKPAHPSRFRLNLLQFMKADPIFKAVPLLLGLISISPQASAEIRAVTAEGEYRMSDRDTKEDAIRLAMEEAKRNALEQVASYLEAVTVVRNFDVTQDEIRSYTAGVAVVLDQKTHTRLENETIVIHVTLTAQVDTDEVVQALAAVKQHEEARHELSSLKQETRSTPSGPQRCEPGACRGNDIRTGPTVQHSTTRVAQPGAVKRPGRSGLDQLDRAGFAPRLSLFVGRFAADSCIGLRRRTIEPE